MLESGTKREKPTRAHFQARPATSPLTTRQNSKKGPFMEAREATAAHRARARELRAQALSYRAIAETLQREGLSCSEYWVAKQARRVPCPQLRGRPRTRTPEERRAKELATRRARYARHREHINRRRREAIAAETPEERALRLYVRRAKYHARRARATSPAPKTGERSSPQRGAARQERARAQQPAPARAPRDS